MKALYCLMLSVGLAVPGVATATPLGNLGLMVVIKSPCQLDPPAGVYAREIKRYMDSSNPDTSTVAMALAVEAVDTRGKIRNGSERQFCSDVRMKYGPGFYGD